MPVIPGVYAAASSVAKTAITSDQSLLLAAATGRRLVGYSAKNTAGAANAGATGNILRGASTVVGTTNRIAGFEIPTNGHATEWFWPGIECAEGITVDHVLGNFEISLYYIDVT